MYLNVNVQYLLSDEEIIRMERINQKYKEQGYDVSLEKAFESMMFMGSKYDIDQKLKWEEIRLGLRKE